MHHILLMHIENKSNALWRDKIARYLHKFVFYGCIFQFLGYYVFPAVTFPHRVP